MNHPDFTPQVDLGGGVHCEVALVHDHRRRCLVVVKQLRDQFREDPVAREAFAREVDVLTRATHPSIVRLLEVHPEEDLPFMVLEHLDGPTLSDLIASSGALPVHQWVSLAVEVTSAVAYLHDEDLVHLDVKPSNIIMGAPATLIDLSLTMEVASAAALDHPVGTDEYMAPEQAAPGTRGRIGPASDVWAIGASLYRAAAGHRAWPQGGHPQLTDPPRVLPDFVPPPVREFLADCLQPDPTDRPSPDALLDRLERMVDHLPKARLAGIRIGR